MATAPGRRGERGVRLRVLGCGGGIGNGRQTTSLLVDGHVLIDAGTGVGRLDAAALCRIRHVLLTHSHLDHLAYLPLMADTVFGRHPDHIQVRGLPATLDALRTHVLNWVIWPDFSALPKGSPLLRLLPMAPGEHLETGDLRLTLVPVAHSVPGAGYLVEGPTGVFAFSGDTGSNEGLWHALNARARLDLLIVEAGFPDRQLELARISGHYTPSLLAADLAHLRHRPRIYITHPKPGMEEEILAQCRRRLPQFQVALLEDEAVFEL